MNKNNCYKLAAVYLFSNFRSIQKKITMKLLTKDILMEFGFNFDFENKNTDLILCKKDFKIKLKPDGSCIYSNTGIDYPLKDLAALKKLYKEVKREDLVISDP